MTGASLTTSHRTPIKPKEKVADGEIFEVTFKVKVNDNVNGEKIYRR